MTTVYSAFLVFLTWGTKAIVKRELNKPEPSSFQSISVIIAARNELSNLPVLLHSLASLNYPENSYELLLVNDHSTDGSREYLDNQTLCPKLKVIHYYHDSTPLMGKKAALQQGIDSAENDILAFSDADCVLPQAWLQEINRSMDEQTDYLLAYSVMRRSSAGTIFRLKNFERSIYYALASAGLYYRIPFTSSACNMVYRKSLFQRSGGFAGIAHLRSGDDDLLLMKMMPFVQKSAYNPRPSMQVVSIDGSDLVAHHNTNIRRASKFRYYPLWLKGLTFFVFSYFSLFYLALGKLIGGKASLLLTCSLIVKTLAEFSFSFSHLKLIKRTELGYLYPLQILVFPAQFIFYALRGSLGKYKWK